MTEAADFLDSLRTLPAAERAAAVRRVDPTGDVLVELADEAARRTTGDATRAVAAAAIVRDVADEIGHTLARARVRRALARAFAYAGRFDEALATAGEATSIALETHPVEAARARLASMHALTELGRFDAALAAGQVARDTLESHGAAALAARADINLGIVHQRRDEPEAAVACFDRARGPLAGETLVVGHLDNSRGEALLVLNDFAGARSAFADALVVFDAADAPVTAAIAEGNLADLAARRGHLHDALLHFERARRRLEATTSPTHLARLLAEQAEAKATLGLPDEALAEFEATLPKLDALGLALEAARARAGMGLVLVRLGRLSEAQTALAAAATAFDDMEHATARARVDLVRAELMTAQGRSDEARRLALRCLAALDERPADTVVARYLLARAAMDSGRFTLAESELSTAVALALELDLPPLVADLLHARGRLHRRLGRRAAAIDDLRAAVDAVERIRGTLQAERLRVACLGNRAGVYAELVATLLDEPEPASIASAFEITEKAKSRALLDRVMAVVGEGDEATGRRGDEGDDPLACQLAATQSELNALYSRAVELDARGDRSDRVETLRRRIRSVEDDLDGLRDRLSITSGSAGLMAPTVVAADVHAMLPAGTRLVEYMILGDELMAFVADGTRITAHPALARVADVVRHLSRLRFQIDRVMRPGAVGGRRFARMVDDATIELAALHDAVLAPLADRIADADACTFVPHGPLHLVPFAALWDGTRSLIDRLAVNIAPSASLLGQTRSNGPASRRHAVIVGVADAVAPDIEREAADVGALFGDAARVLLGDAATSRSVVDAAADADVLHLACHGRFDPLRPLSSGLRLADRWFTVRDIYGMSIDAELVTLSGCETGVNTAVAGDELMGLLRGFFAAGARRLLVSMWRTDDARTTEFMCDFYRRRWSERGVQNDAETLRATQLAMRERHPHPAHWAPFSLVGAPR